MSKIIERHSSSTNTGFKNLSFSSINHSTIICQHFNRDWVLIIFKSVCPTRKINSYNTETTDLSRSSTKRIEIFVICFAPQTTTRRKSGRLSHIIVNKTKFQIRFCNLFLKSLINNLIIFICSKACSSNRKGKRSPFQLFIHGIKKNSLKKFYIFFLCIHSINRVIRTKFVKEIVIIYRKICERGLITSKFPIQCIDKGSNKFSDIFVRIPYKKMTTIFSFFIYLFCKQTTYNQKVCKTCCPKCRISSIHCKLFYLTNKRSKRFRRANSHTR